jgi:hypothetical protein
MKISCPFLKGGKRCPSTSRDVIEDNILLVSIIGDLSPIFLS